MKKTLLTLMAIIGCFSLSFAQTNNEYDKALKKMFKVSGAEEVLHTLMDELFTLYESQYADVPKDFLAELRKEFLGDPMDEITKQLSPIYQKHFSLEEIKELTSFFSTPIGKKYSEKAAIISQEAMRVGQEWGLKIAKDVAKKMKEKGYESY